MKKQELYISALALGILAGCGGINTNKSLTTSEDSFSYVSGYETSQRMKQNGIDAIEYGSFIKGLKDGFAKDSGYDIKQEMMGKVYQGYVQGVQSKKIKLLQKATNDFLAKLSKEPGVSPLASKGFYKEVKKGSGGIPQAYDTITCYFVIKNSKGKVFQNSRKENKPFVGNIASLNLPPLEESFQKTASGGTFEVYISNTEFPSLAKMAGTFEDMYGITVLEVDLINVKPGKKPSAEELQYIPPPQP